MELITKSARETQSFGQALAADIVSGKVSHVLALKGELGSGKTTFVQGLAKGLGVKKRITSPTFILMREYAISHQPLAISYLYHVDLYRLEGDLSREIENLG